MQFPARGCPVVLNTSQIKPRTHPQHEAHHPPCCIRRHAFPRSKGRSTQRTAFPLLALRRHRFLRSKGDLRREPPFLSSHSAGIVSPDQRVSAVLQHRLHSTISHGCWCCRCCCCCYCHAAASCRCSSGPPLETLYRD